jgi:hypothetical protein
MILSLRSMPFKEQGRNRIGTGQKKDGHKVKTLKG